MKQPSEYMTYLLDCLEPLGDVRAKRMFGGYGLYCGPVFFGIVPDDVPYFKTSDVTRGDYEAAGSEAFTYATKKGDKALVTYWRVPSEVLDDPETLCQWARRAINAKKAAA